MDDSYFHLYKEPRKLSSEIKWLRQNLVNQSTIWCFVCQCFSNPTLLFSCSFCRSPRGKIWSFDPRILSVNPISFIPLNELSTKLCGQHETGCEGFHCKILSHSTHPLHSDPSKCRSHISTCSAFWSIVSGINIYGKSTVSFSPHLLTNGDRVLGRLPEQLTLSAQLTSRHVLFSFHRVMILNIFIFFLPHLITEMRHSCMRNYNAVQCMFVLR